MNAANINNLIPRLQRWYLAQCDGDWEHSLGVKIGTLDNPGWTLDIDLESTPLDGRSFTRVERGLDAREPNVDWFTCFIEDKQFKGRGGPEKLAEMIAIFLNWAEA